MRRHHFPEEIITNIYIAYRDLYDYFQKNTGMGGNSVNDEFRLCTVKDDIYLLSDGKGKYAVTKETAEPAEISGNGIIYTMGINGSDPVPFFGGAGFTGMSPQTAPAAPSDGGSRCPGCGAPRGTGKYCTECGMLIGG